MAALRPDGRPFGIRPEHVAIGAAAGSEPFQAEAEVEMVEPMGADTRSGATSRRFGVPFPRRKA